MNIIVCIKQVPSTSHVKIDEKTGSLMRDGVDSKMNPYDLVALETALQIKHPHRCPYHRIEYGTSASQGDHSRSLPHGGCRRGRVDR